MNVLNEKNGGFLTGMSTSAKTNDLAFGSRLQMRLSTVAAMGYISVMILSLTAACQENTNLKKLYRAQTAYPSV